MDADFWHHSWQRRDIGFHKEAVHHLLERYFPQLKLPKGSRVLVPLCGKSLDLLWLREQGFAVVGVELSRVAIEEFFSENRLEFEVQSGDDFALYQADQLEIFCGDFFSLTPQMTGTIAAVYDRAALVALPPEMRVDYAIHLGKLLPRGAQLLTISFDYPQAQMAGPPFAVPETEIKELFAASFAVEKLHNEAALRRHKKLQMAGVQKLQEEVFRLERN